MAASRLRGVQARIDMLSAEGGTLGLDEVAASLGVTRQGADTSRRAGALLAVDIGKRVFRYPAWQVAGGGTLPGLAYILRTLDVNPWTQLSWFLSGNTYLGGERPLDVLRRREPDATQRVVRAACACGQQGAA